MHTPAIRAWIDLANAEWDREARSYGPDDDDDGEPSCPNVLPAGSTQVLAESLASALMPWDDGYFPDEHTSGQWLPDDDMPPETVVIDCPPSCPNERVYCECPVMEPYPDGWRTLAEHEAFSAMVTVFGSARRPISFDGRNAYLTGEPWTLRGRLALADIDLPHTEDVFSGPGLVVSLY